MLPGVSVAGLKALYRGCGRCPWGAWWPTTKGGGFVQVQRREERGSEASVVPNSGLPGYWVCSVVQACDLNSARVSSPHRVFVWGIHSSSLGSVRDAKGRPALQPSDEVKVQSDNRKEHRSVGKKVTEPRQIYLPKGALSDTEQRPVRPECSEWAWEAMASLGSHP